MKFRTGVQLPARSAMLHDEGGQPHHLGAQSLIPEKNNHLSIFPVAWPDLWRLLQVDYPASSASDNDLSDLF